jgi:hypothetical protein
MSLIRLYTRVLELLGKEARLGWILAGANLLLASAQFAEPVLFGRIVDVLSGKPQTGPLSSNSAWPRSACSPSRAAPQSRSTPTGWRIASARRC